MRQRLYKEIEIPGIFTPLVDSEKHILNQSDVLAYIAAFTYPVILGKAFSILLTITLVIIW